MRWFSVGHHTKYDSYWVVFGRFGFRYWREPAFRRLGFSSADWGEKWVFDLWWFTIYW